MAARGTTPKAAPTRSLIKITEWVLQATRHVFDRNQQRPDDALLVNAADGWAIGFTGPLELVETAAGSAIRATFAKPRDEGPTTRDFDPVALAMLMLLCAPGGRLVLEPHGPKGDFYYLRLVIVKQHRNGTPDRLPIGTPFRAWRDAPDQPGGAG